MYTLKKASYINHTYILSSYNSCKDGYSENSRISIILPEIGIMKNTYVRDQEYKKGI